MGVEPTCNVAEVIKGGYSNPTATERPPFPVTKITRYKIGKQTFTVEKN